MDGFEKTLFDREATVDAELARLLSVLEALGHALALPADVVRELIQDTDCSSDLAQAALVTAREVAMAGSLYKAASWIEVRAAWHRVTRRRTNRSSL